MKTVKDKQILMAADFAGYPLKEAIKEYLEKKHTDKSSLNVKDIYEFAKTAKLEDIKDLVENQIKCNIAIANEGIYAFAPLVFEEKSSSLTPYSSRTSRTHNKIFFK